MSQAFDQGAMLVHVVELTNCTGMPKAWNNRNKPNKNFQN